MNKGYRLSAPVALANYYADVRNYANFNEAVDPNFLQRGRQAVGGAARSVDGAVQALGAGLGGGRKGMNQAITGMAIGNPQAIAQGTKRAVKGARMRGYGAVGLGAAGLAGAGYLGSRMLRGRGQAAEPEEPQYAGYDPRRYMGGQG